MTTTLTHERAVLSAGIGLVAQMMTATLADEQEVSDATSTLRAIVAETLSMTREQSPARVHMLGIETAIDRLSEETDERAYGIWAIARDAFRFNKEQETDAVSAEISEVA